MPPNTHSVARPGRHGNPFGIQACIENGFASDRAQAQRACVQAFRDWLRGDTWAAGSGEIWDERRRQYLVDMERLRDKNVACFCDLCDDHADGLPLGVECEACAPCHGDVLLVEVNS